jgi:hypothetical protein
VATWVDAGAAWATAYAADERHLEAGSRLLETALSTSATEPSVSPLVHGVVDRSSRETRYL